MILYYNNNQPFVEGICLNDLTKSIETPFYLYSQKNIEDSYKKIKKFLNVDIFYSVKANSNQAIISIMRKLGVGADVVSIGELERALRIGILPHDIIFEGVGKASKDLEYAIMKKIKQINIESIEELIKINDLGQSLQQKVDIGIRINPDIDGNTLDKISTGKKSDKFGISFKILPEVCQMISEKKFINLVGISCHVGSQIQDLNIYEKVFLKMKEATKITESLGMIVKNLNLGGGFPSVYQNEKNIDFSKLSNLLNKIFMDSNFKISFEPGRSLVATSGLLVTKILTLKVNDSINFLIVDAGMQTFLRPSLYNSFHNIISLNQEGSLKKYTVGGPICESSDILAKDIELPSQQSGNFLAICDVGAYGSVMASNYNSRNLPAEILIHDDKFSIIRNLENFSSVIDRDIIPDWLSS